MHLCLFPFFTLFFPLTVLAESEKIMLFVLILTCFESGGWNLMESNLAREVVDLSTLNFFTGFGGSDDCLSFLFVAVMLVLEIAQENSSNLQQLMTL